MLQPGERWSCQLRFSFVDGYDAVRDEIYKAGNLGIRVLPAMVVQEKTNAYVELKSKSDIDGIEFLSDNITVKERKRVGDKTLLTLSFKGRGQKSLKFYYGGCWTNIHFYCIEDIAQLLKARGRFILEREFYQNPDDPYHRNHCLLYTSLWRPTSFEQHELRKLQKICQTRNTPRQLAVQCQNEMPIANVRQYLAEAKDCRRQFSITTAQRKD